MGAGYDMQILPHNDVYDFDGDGIGDVFFGINQSGTRSKFLYYVMKMNAKEKKFECIGFEIGESWITEDYITTKIPLGLVELVLLELSPTVSCPKDLHCTQQCSIHSLGIANPI
jgi:hypothetical protein